MIDSTKYAYSVGRVRVAENYMMDEVKLLRLVDAPDIKEAQKILIECRYREEDDYMDMLDHEHKALYSYIRSIIPDLDIFNLFFYKYDTHNIKVLLKSEFLEKPHDEIASDVGVFDYETLKSFIHNRNFDSLPKRIADGILQSIDDFSKTNDPQLIDLIMDKAYYTYFNETISKAHDAFLKEFMIIRTDLLNLKAFLRIKRVFQNESFLARTLIPNGSISLEQLETLYQLDEQEFFNYIKNTRYSSIFQTGDIEKNCDDYITAFLKSKKYDPTGIAPVLGYMLGKETEIKNARIVMMGKANRISKDKTKERLRMCYV